MADDIHQRVDDLEARLRELTEQLTSTRQQLAEAQLDQWKGRLDDIEVQLSLARLEAREQLTPVLEQLRGRVLDAQRQLSTAAGAANDVALSLRSGFEAAVDDLRVGLRDAIRNSRPD